MKYPKNLVKYGVKLDGAALDVEPLGLDVKGRFIAAGERIIEQLDEAIEGKNWDYVTELEAQFDHHCVVEVKTLLVGHMMKHLDHMHDAMKVLEYITEDADRRCPAAVSNLQKLFRQMSRGLLTYDCKTDGILEE